MKHGKLVRDNIPNIIAGRGEQASIRTLNNAEYMSALDLKLQEEVAEYLADKNIEELADIVEVIYAIVATIGSDRAEIEQIRAAKAAEKGTFSKKIFLIETKDSI